MLIVMLDCKKRWTKLIRKAILLKFCTITSLCEDGCSCTKKQIASTEFAEHPIQQLRYHCAVKMVKKQTETSDGKQMEQLISCGSAPGSGVDLERCLQGC